MADVIDLTEKMCPFLVMYLLQEVGTLRSGESKTFVVNDALAIKSVPEEIDDIDGLSTDIRKLPSGSWEIIVSRA